jgi:ABC-type amino acid transport substrate-binding protein
MSTKYFFCCFLYAFSSFSLLANESLKLSSTEQPYVVRLGTKVHWAPYHLDTPHGADGLAVRAVACIMSRINQPFIIEKKPWKRVQFETQNHKLDGFFAASKNDERDGYAIQSDVFLPQVRYLYILKKKHSEDIETYSLEYIENNFQIGARAGSNALHAVQKKGFNVGLIAQNENQLLHALELGRVNAIIENSLVFEDLLKNTKRNTDDYHKVIFGKKSMGVYFSRNFLAKNPDFLAKFNQNIPPCAVITEN